MKFLTLLSFLILTAAVAPSYAISASYEISADSIYRHISVLADDSLEGREVGEPGEWKAAGYIQAVFEKAGLLPMGDTGTFLQPFYFIKSIEAAESTNLAINGHKLNLGDDYVPLKQSGSGAFEFDEIVNVGFGITLDSADGDYDDYAGKSVEGKAVLIKRLAPEGEAYRDIEFNKYSSLTDKIMSAQKHKAAAVFFVTPSEVADDSLPAPAVTNITAKTIPIIFLKREGLAKMQLDISDPKIMSAVGQVEMLRTRDTGYNVVAYLPAQTDTTVILGAHYDHLGWGGPASLYHGEEPMIHNGADDNASGVSAILELARYYSARRDSLRYSLLFIAFSGEEAGILGSTWFAKNMTVDSAKVRMMLNLDMIGRLQEQEEGLAILGTGTCLEFKQCFDSLTVEDLKIVQKKSGSGPSDNTPFNNRKIPSLFFFTGAHKDYHRPSDDVDKIDTKGIVQTANLVSDIIDYFDDRGGTLTFQKTKGSDRGGRPAFSVSLGITPDHVAEVEGLRIDGISAEKPAQRAGLLESDIIIKIGSITIGDIYDYMNSLGKLHKGDTTAVIVIRDNDTLSIDVIF